MRKQTSLPAKAVSDDVSGFIQELRGRMHVTSTNIAEVTTFLQNNHAKPARDHKIKDYAFYKAVYTNHSIIIHDLEAAATFLGQLHPDVLRFIRIIRILVDECIIWQSPNNVLDALRPIFACSPARCMADVQLTAVRAPPIVVPQNPFVSTKSRKRRSRKHKSYPCFVVKGIVMCKVTLLMKRHAGQEFVTKQVMDCCLDQKIEPLKVNFLERLPPELREMIYACNLPTPGVELIRYEGTRRSDFKSKDLLWQEFLRMILVCPMMSAEVIALVSRKYKFTLRMDSLDVDTRWGYDRPGPTFREIFQVVKESLPDWLLAHLSEVELCSGFYARHVTFRDFLPCLLKDILCKVRPEADVDVRSVPLTHEGPAIGSSMDFSIHASILPGLQFKLIFLSKSVSYLPRAYRNNKILIAATLHALRLNINWLRTHVNIDSEGPFAVIDGCFNSDEDRKLLGVFI